MEKILSHLEKHLLEKNKNDIGWFEVRKWMAFADPKDESGNWKQAFSTREIITLDINIMKADFSFGSYSNFYGQSVCSSDNCMGCFNSDDCAGASGCEWIISGTDPYSGQQWGNCRKVTCLAGSPVSGTCPNNITISVKQIMDFGSWPPKELDSNSWSSNTLRVGKTKEFSGQGAGIDSNYLLRITPSSGVWNPGFYNLLLNINDSETGFGFFQVISYYSNAIFTDSNGSYIWNGRSSNILFFNLSASRSTTNYFKVCSSQMDSNCIREPINVTIEQIRLMYNTEDSWFPTEFRYIEGGVSNDFTPSISGFNGSAFMNITKTSGNWPSGWYNGEVILKDTASGDKSTANIWFNIKDFESFAYSTQWQIKAEQNASITLRVVDPSSWQDRIGNYSITSIKENTYSAGIMTQSLITKYFPSYCNITLNDTSCSIQISPEDTVWTAGFHDLQLNVQDDNLGGTAKAWASFNIVPFTVELFDTPWKVRATADVKVSVYLSKNLSVQSYQQDWMTWPPVKTYFNVSTFSGDDNVVQYTNNERIGLVVPAFNQTDYDYFDYDNTAVLYIKRPDEGWTKQWYDLTLYFNDSTDFLEKWLWFEIAQAYTGWPWTEKWEYGTTENITISMNMYNPETWETINEWVNVTGITYMNWNNVPSDWWTTKGTDPSLSFSYNARYSNVSGGTYINPSEYLSGSNIINVESPSSGWTPGWYDLKISVNGSLGSAKLFSSFSVVSSTGFAVYLDTNQGTTSTCNTDCWMCTVQTECSNSPAGCSWDSVNNLCSVSSGNAYTTCNDSCFQCFDSNSCSSSNADCSWTSDPVYGGGWCDPQCVLDCSCDSQNNCMMPKCAWDLDLSTCSVGWDDCSKLTQEWACNDHGVECMRHDANMTSRCRWNNSSNICETEAVSPVCSEWSYQMGESNCMNGIDDDSNGNIDCSDSSCEWMSCDSNNFDKKCNQGVCSII